LTGIGFVIKLRSMRLYPFYGISAEVVCGDHRKSRIFPDLKRKIKGNVFVHGKVVLPVDHVLASYDSLLHAPLPVGAAEDMVSGVLLHYDIPGLRELWVPD
jgi:hypothetical protein